jgi:hypothetical protein
MDWFTRLTSLVTELSTPATRHGSNPHYLLPRRPLFPHRATHSKDPRE